MTQLFFNLFVGLLLNLILKGLKILFTLSEVPLIYCVEMYFKLAGYSFLLSSLKLLLTFLMNLVG